MRQLIPTNAISNGTAGEIKREETHIGLLLEIKKNAGNVREFLLYYVNSLFWSAVQSQ